MAGELTIRHWRPEDSEKLAELFRRSVREIAGRDYNPAQIAAWSGAIVDWSAWTERMRTRITFVAIQNDEPVGFMQYEPLDHIDMAYVHADHQREGVASALLVALETEARKHNADELRVEASITARPFFAARDYELLIPQIVRAHGQEFVSFRMRKKFLSD